MITITPGVVILDVDTMGVWKSKKFVQLVASLEVEYQT